MIETKIPIIILENSQVVTSENISKFVTPSYNKPIELSTPSVTGSTVPIPVIGELFLLAASNKTYCYASLNCGSVIVGGGFSYYISASIFVKPSSLISVNWNGFNPADSGNYLKLILIPYDGLNLSTTVV